MIEMKQFFHVERTRNKLYFKIAKKIGDPKTTDRNVIPYLTFIGIMILFEALLWFLSPAAVTLTSTL